MVYVSYVQMSQVISGIEFKCLKIQLPFKQRLVWFTHHAKSRLNCNLMNKTLLAVMKDYINY